MPKTYQTSIKPANLHGMEFPARVVEGEGIYLPLKYLTAILMGTTDDRAFRVRIKRDPILCDLWRMLPFETNRGPQEMFTIEHAGLPRWIDRLDLDRVRPEFRSQVLEFMWAVTLEARRLFYGEVESRALPAIVPTRQQGMSLRDADVQRLLYALAERIGHVEMSQRDIQGLLLALASGDTDSIVRTCPQCGYVFGEEA